MTEEPEKAALKAQLTTEADIHLYTHLGEEHTWERNMW